MPSKENYLAGRALSVEAQRVLEVLAEHHGLAAAIPREELARLVGISGRLVQRIIKNLVERHSISIGSKTTRPAGYYLITTREDFDQADRQLLHRLTSIGRRLARLRRCSLPVVMAQAVMDYSNDNSGDFPESP